MKIIRIVKMNFDKEKVHLFLNTFKDYHSKIASVEGCSHLELWNENDSSTYFTYSHWENENYLEQYRNSALFKEVWSKTKIYFNSRPEAWTVKKVNLN